ncbi:hypothetical protein SEA_CAMBIARE_37 [Mycobacterium phage Cambiare]|uniref:Uncharacterized protein n=1 Tax=Mycobacterium phage Cambiare TaxID=1647305 RepID=A0A0F6YQ80_9CAUD|nr:hypothetical protein AVT48_gp37 [Mycobacterium phage Cambiare]AKF14539.1 hypothetical protein SEA_CAMBIARE_37 [Mycobacterium phage Cambiare]
MNIIVLGIIAALAGLSAWLLVGPRGRHHLHPRWPARPFERERVTVKQLQAKLLRENAMFLTIVPDVQGFTTEIRRGIERLDVVLIGGGGAGRGIADAHAGIAG